MDILITLHSALRWILLVLLVVAILQAYKGRKTDIPFADLGRKSALFTLIAMDMQLLLGLILYFAGPWGIKNISNNGMGVVMKDSYARFFAMEHLVGMLLAILLIHIGFAKSKRGADEKKKHQTIFIYYLIALLLILASIPWPFRAGFEGIGWI